MEKAKVKKAGPKKTTTKKTKPVPVKPKDYTEDFEYICMEIEKGVATRTAVRAFMSSQTFYRLINDNQDLSKRYARACEARADVIFEDILEIADNRGGDTFINSDGVEMVDHAVIQRDRLRVDARKWMAGKMNPKKYGDKIDLTSDGEKINTVTFFELPKNGRDEGK
ncbi:MAG: hypothetical protein J7577_00775 [Sphingobacteriaceae bacterium]|nr:hypothetical protein [Sphingobacteriaceae bacterium]